MELQAATDCKDYGNDTNNENVQDTMLTEKSQYITLSRHYTSTMGRYVCIQRIMRKYTIYLKKEKKKGESMDDWFPLPKCKLSKYYFKTM